MILAWASPFKQVPKFPSSGNFKFPIFKFRELQVPKFQNKWKNILKQYLQKSFLSEKQFGTQY